MIKKIFSIRTRRRFHTKISYEILKNEKYLEGVRDVFFGSFSGTYKDRIIETSSLEPLSSILSLSSLKEFIYHVTESAINDEMSFIAKHDEQVVSFVLNKDFTKRLRLKPEISDIFERDHDWDPIIEIFRKVNQPIEGKYQPKQGEFFQIWCGGTILDNFYRKMGLFTKLLEKSLEKARMMDFKYAIAEVSSNSTQKILSGIGFQIENEIKYSTFEYPENKYPFKGRLFQGQSIYCMLKPLK